MDRIALPIDDVIPELQRALQQRTVAVLEAMPGAGKTTRVPLALIAEEWLQGRRIIMLEPRRLAARAAAHYMARQLGEDVGQSIGYRVRGESRVSRNTRVEIVTEGILARLRSSDAALEQYGLVIFDEFHERSIHADLGLALVLQTQEVLRPDLRVLVMSATLDGDAVARCVTDADGAAPIIRSSGRVFPVETVHREPRHGEPLEQTVARCIRQALPATEGDVLVFLPGATEQHRVERTITRDVHDSSHPFRVHLLHGSQSLAEQQAAIAPATDGMRKVVLATNIAETSLTIEDVRVVIDSGLARVPRYSPRIGLTHLRTTRASRASVDQRRGRAGRTAPGWCYRLWSVHEDAMLAPRTVPEILDADLSTLALELADAGVDDPNELRWIDTPPAGNLQQARSLLQQLGAIDASARITPHGKRIASLPAEPRLSHMLAHASDRGIARHGALVAALLEERDIYEGYGSEVPADLRLRIELIERLDTDEGNALRVHRDRLRRITTTASDLQRRLGDASRAGVPLTGGKRKLDVNDTGLLLALAYPDRIAQRRSGSDARYLLRNGVTATLPAHDGLAAEPLLVVAELFGKNTDQRIVRAAPVARSDIEALFGTQITDDVHVWWDRDAGLARGRRKRMLGAIALDELALSRLDDDQVHDVLIEELRARGIANWPWTKSATQLRERMAFVAHHDPSWPDVSDTTLEASIEQWLGPSLTGIRRWQQLESLDWSSALLALLDWNKRASLDRLAPPVLEVPSGSRVAIDYRDAENPVLAVRLQEVFGWSDTPRVMQDRVPLTLHLLSPAHRPVQVTRDLGGFWRNSYFDVRKDLRGRYPRHPWPDDPLHAPATRRAKPRGT